MLAPTSISRNRPLHFGFPACKRLFCTDHGEAQQLQQFPPKSSARKAPSPSVLKDSPAGTRKR